VAEVADECVNISLSEQEMREQGLLPEYINLHGFFSKKFTNVIYINKDSSKVDFLGLQRKFDLIFIDGDHKYEGVLADTRNAFKVLNDANSVIVWHDYSFDPEFVSREVLAAILDGTPQHLRDNLFHVSNTMCAIYMNPIRFSHGFKSGYTVWPSTPDKVFSVSVRARPL
jgi:hypothetical protein